MLVKNFSLVLYLNGQKLHSLEEKANAPKGVGRRENTGYRSMKGKTYEIKDLSCGKTKTKVSGPY